MNTKLLVVLSLLSVLGVASALWVEWTTPEVMFSTETKAPVYLVDYKGAKHPIPAEGLPRVYEKVWIK
jgi:hypothetical protein